MRMTSKKGSRKHNNDDGPFKTSYTTNLWGYKLKCHSKKRINNVLIEKKNGRRFLPRNLSLCLEKIAET